MTKHFSTLKHEVWLPYKFAVGPVFQRFYEGLKEMKILGNRCGSCGKTYVPPRSFCPGCNSDIDEWTELPQEGEVVTWTLATEPFFGMPMEPPFVGALIRLDGTDCDLLHLVGGFDMDSPEAVKEKIGRGTKVKAVWKKERSGHMLDIKHFEPI